MFWDKTSRLSVSVPRPAEVMMNTIMPIMPGYQIFEEGDIPLNDIQYMSRDILVLSSVIQWFGTGIGQNWITERPSTCKASRSSLEFVERFAIDGQKFIYAAIHQCLATCRPGYCDHTPKQITKRDRLVVGAFMIWLGRVEGRDYMERYTDYIGKVHKKRRPLMPPSLLRRVK